jgi:hypothetical protein
MSERPEIAKHRWSYSPSSATFNRKFQTTTSVRSIAQGGVQAFLASPGLHPSLTRPRPDWLARAEPEQTSKPDGRSRRPSGRRRTHVLQCQQKPGRKKAQTAVESEKPKFRSTAVMVSMARRLRRHSTVPTDLPWLAVLRSTCSSSSQRGCCHSSERTSAASTSTLTACFMRSIVRTRRACCPFRTRRPTTPASGPLTTSTR